MMDNARPASQFNGETGRAASVVEDKPWDGDGVPLKDSNCALIGSDEDKAARKHAAMAEPAWEGAGIKPGLQVWRIEEFQVVPWPEDRYGEFMMGDSYIVLRTTEDPDSGKLLHDIHFWLGRDTTPDEMGTAAYKTVELDDLFDGEPIQHREVQEGESQEFRSFFPNLTYRKGGKASGFRKASSAIELYEHKMYRVRKMQVGGLQLEEVALHRNSLNDGDVFIIDAGAKIYIWEGRQASPFEKNLANKEAERLESERDGRATATHDIDDDFWDLVGGRGPIKAAEEVTDSSAMAKAFTTRLYQISDANAELSCHEVGHGQLSESMLQSKDVMMLVTSDEMFLWVGNGSSTAEGRSCYRLAMDYLKVNNRPMSTPIHLFKEGQTIRNERWLAAFAEICDAELYEPASVETPVAENVKATDASSSISGSATLEPGPDEAFVGDSTDEYASGTEVFYSYADLSDPRIWRCKPDIADQPDEREHFLAPDIFEEVFGMSKEDFAKLPKWKQMQQKKDTLLF